MKRIVTIFLLILISQNLFAVDNEEFRATWVITWELIDAGKSAEQNKALAWQILDNHQKANMNAVLWQCRQSGTAYYNSSFEPWGYYAGSQDPGYDPLGYAIEEAHKRGMELHAWFNVFHSSSTAPGTPAAEHPEWVCTDENGLFMTVDKEGRSVRCLSPGIAKVREYLINVAMEIVRNYDIDGIHFDFVRWNEYTYHPSNNQTVEHLEKQATESFPVEGMITDQQIAELNQNQSLRYIYDVEHPYRAGIPAGFSSWADWRRWCVTEFVRVFNDSAKAVKPWVRVSVASLGRYNWDLGIGWDAYKTVFQEAALWFNEGYIDQLTPMHYHWFDYQGFYNMLAGPDGNSTSTSCWGYYIQKGIAAGRLYSCGPSATDLNPDNPKWMNPIPMVNAARAVPWVDGLQFFSYGAWKKWDYIDKAKIEIYPTKTKIRATKSIVSTTPDAPTLQIMKLDSLNYQLIVTVPASITTDHRYSIYRSSDKNLDWVQAENIDLHFGKNSYSFTDHFTGRQDYNGIYNYAATTLDRYWNESAISNTVQTDPIPSLPPTVIATDPMDDDTIAVNSPIIFYFSKTMNSSTFGSAITITPAIDVEQLIWNAGNKSLTLDVKGNFAYATNYTITIGTPATDVNGKSIDGNGDGTAGDPFSLHFQTRAVDNAGPIVISSYPDFNTPADNFDVDDVISFVFDEFVNPQTVLDSTLVLNRNSEKIRTQTMITAVGDRSVINLKAYEPLVPSTEYSLLLRNIVKDTIGNQMISDLQVSFQTSNERYSETKLIDNFSFIGYWWQPSQSGQFYGIVASGTLFGYSKEIYLPASATAPAYRRSAFIQYQWMETPPPEGYLLREHINSGPPIDVIFDTTYILQCYVYGDGSHNKFRFSLQEVDGQGYPLEVSQWVTIDWYGWKLLEWDLTDPNSVGTWLGNEIMDGKSYYVDSFQLTHDNMGSLQGKIYVDNLRVVKKSAEPVNVKYDNPPVASTFQLFQNYPNPFNPTTTIPFNLPNRGKVVLEVYDILGRKVFTLVNQTLEASHHELQFDGSRLASGIYFYRLEFEGQIKNRQMLLIK